MFIKRIKRSLSLWGQFLSSREGGLRQKAVRSGIWVSFSAVALSTLSFAKSIVLARLLTPDHFGLMAACMVVIRAIEVFTETGVGAALVQRPAAVEPAMPTVYTILAVRGLILAAIVVAVSPFVAQFYDQAELMPLLHVLAVGLLLGGLGNVNTIVAQKELNFRPLFYLQTIVVLVDFTVTIALAFWWQNVWALVVGNVLKTLISVPLSFALLPGRPKFGWNMAIARELARYGKYITGLTIVVYVTTEIDNVVIGKVLGMQALGVYVVAYMLANLPATHIAKVIAAVMFATYSKIQNDRRNLCRAYLQTTQFVSTLALPSAVGLAVLADPLIALVYGPKWREAALVLPVLCVFGALRAISSVNGYVFNAIGRPSIPFYMNSIKLVLIALMIVPASRNYGLLGAAVAVTAPSLVMFVVSYVVFSRVLELPLQTMFMSILPAGLASLVMGGTLLLTEKWYSFDSPISLASAVLLGGTLYCVLSWTRISATIRLLIKR